MGARPCLGALAVAVLAGCAGTTPRLPLPPEPVTVEPRAGEAIPVARSYSEVLVRAFVEDAEGRRREIGGAECLLEAGALGVRFESPGRVLVPVPRAGAPVLGAGCKAGELAGVARRAPTRVLLEPPFYPPGYPFGYRYGRWYDPFWEPRSGVWLGAPFGDPFWGYGPWGRRALVTGYHDVEVILR
jgi:hypothetical protein